MGIPGEKHFVCCGIWKKYGARRSFLGEARRSDHGELQGNQSVRARNTLLLVGAGGVIYVQGAWSYRQRVNVKSVNVILNPRNHSAIIADVNRYGVGASRRELLGLN